MEKHTLRNERTGKIRYLEDVERIYEDEYPIYYAWAIELDFTVNKKNMKYFYKTIKRYMVDEYSMFSHTVIDGIKIIDYVLGNKYRKIDSILRYQKAIKHDTDYPELESVIILNLIEEPVLVEYLEDIKTMMDEILYKMKDVGLINKLQGG